MYEPVKHLCNRLSSACLSLFTAFIVHFRCLSVESSALRVTSVHRSLYTEEEKFHGNDSKHNRQSWQWKGWPSHEHMTLQTLSLSLSPSTYLSLYSLNTHSPQSDLSRVPCSFLMISLSLSLSFASLSQLITRSSSLLFSTASVQMSFLRCLASTRFFFSFSLSSSTCFTSACTLECTRYKLPQNTEYDELR